MSQQYSSYYKTIDGSGLYEAEIEEAVEDELTSGNNSASFTSLRLGQGTAVSPSLILGPSPSTTGLSNLGATDLNFSLAGVSKFRMTPGKYFLGDAVTAEDQVLSIFSKQSAVIQMEGDTDNVDESDDCLISMTIDANNINGQMRLDSTDNDLVISMAAQGQGREGNRILFQTGGLFTAPAQGTIPTFSTPPVTAMTIYADNQEVEFSSGIVNALGALATPSYTFNDDLNTGMYSPGANRISLVTGGVEGLTIGAFSQVSLVGDVTNTGQPYLFMKRNAAQTTTNNTLATIDWDTTLATNATDAPTESSGVITINSTGVYYISYSLIYVGHASGVRFAYILTDVSGENYAYSTVHATTTVGIGLNGAVVVALADTDTFSVKTQQNSGGNLDIRSAPDATLSVVKLF